MATCSNCGKKLGLLDRFGTFGGRCRHCSEAGRKEYVQLLETLSLNQPNLIGPTTDKLTRLNEELSRDERLRLGSGPLRDYAGRVLADDVCSEEEEGLFLKLANSSA